MVLLCWLVSRGCFFMLILLYVYFLYCLTLVELVCFAYDAVCLLDCWCLCLVVAVFDCVFIVLLVWLIICVWLLLLLCCLTCFICCLSFCLQLLILFAVDLVSCDSFIVVCVYDWFIYFVSVYCCLVLVFYLLFGFVWFALVAWLRCGRLTSVLLCLLCLVF